MTILAIESSCDETAAAVVRDGTDVLSDVIASQIERHKVFGGVVPEIASRLHIQNISRVVDAALAEAGISVRDADAVAVTCGPGLVGALLVGVSYAKALAFAAKKPLVPVHHIKGHICANFIENQDMPFPFVCLVASGGHSNIVLVNSHTDFRVLARTRDDAAGEAFDKVARVLGLGYPGGPEISRIAETGDPAAIKFPRVRIDGGLDFSFSGVKTAVINYIHNAEQKDSAYNVADVAASFQQAVVDVLVSHTLEAAKMHGVPAVALAGGVACNAELRRQMEAAAVSGGLAFYAPRPALCTDNAAMIGCGGYFELLEGKTADMSLNAAAMLNF